MNVCHRILYSIFNGDFDTKLLMEIDLGAGLQECFMLGYYKAL